MSPTRHSIYPDRLSAEEIAAQEALDAARRARWLREGQEIRALRLARGLKLEQLAPLLGLGSKGALSDIELGRGRGLPDRCWPRWLAWRDQPEQEPR